ncbi:hypothetical protein AeRB84_017004 [Aphanomyces euteiches]|nr:hypothetical protein AeRB84_017004 [Aphanomyces euteiches]
MRLPKVAIDLQVDICKPYVPNRMETRTVILEQLFQREGFGQQSKYRLIGMRAILKALTDHGFYASDPHEDDRMQASSEAFSREHPLLNRCLGAVDGTHVPVRVPDSLKDRYRNRKGGYTTNVLGVVGEIGRFLAVYAGAEG